MNRRKRNLRIALVIIAAYAAVIVLLLAAESGAEGSSIHSIGDAVWYSIITLTTVGYGDISPVTPVGRVLGIILALCSLGLITALIGILMSLISDRAVPRRRLRSSKDCKWYVFNEENEQSSALACSVLADDPDAVIVFCRSDEKGLNRRDAVRFDSIPEELIEIKGETQGIMFFCMGDDSWDNYRMAAEAAGLGIDTYCLTDFGSDEIMDDLHTFSRKEIISRCYWRDHPLGRDEKIIVLIGSGDIAAELLERGLLTNVFEPGRYVSYHVFGDSSFFRKSHPEAVKALCGGNPEDDSLFLHEECWEYHTPIIRNADRIIICEDDDRSDLGIYKELRKWFPTSASVHVRLSSDLEQIDSFGSSKTIFTLRSFVRDDINRLAVTLNDIYNEGSDRPAAWNDLSDHLKRSNIAAADHMIVKIRYLLDDDSITELTEENCRSAYEKFSSAEPEVRDACREMEHRRWMRFQQMYNWVFAEERNDQMRRHPMMVQYSDLSEEDKEKDAYAWEILDRIADRSAVS